MMRSTGSSEADNALPTSERRLDTPRAAGVAGLVFAVLFVVSILLVRSHPDGGRGAY
jgi:hypothetical protein